MTQDQPSGAPDPFVVKGSLDLERAADYCRNEFDRIQRVQANLVAMGHLPRPDPGMVNRAILHMQMARFFDHCLPLKEQIRELMRREVAFQQREMEDADGREKPARRPRR